MANSPTSRTLALFRHQGYICQVVERWNQHARIRQDLFGCIDVVAIAPIASELGSGGIFGLQACAGASHAARRAKSIAEPRLRTWLRAGGQFAIVSWSKRGDRGKLKRWTPRIEWIQLSDLPGVRTDELSGNAG